MFPVDRTAFGLSLRRGTWRAVFPVGSGERFH